MGQSLDCQPHFGPQVGRRKDSYANHTAQVGEKTYKPAGMGLFPDCRFVIDRILLACL